MTARSTCQGPAAWPAGDPGACPDRLVGTVRRDGTVLRVCQYHADRLVEVGWSRTPIGRPRIGTEARSVHLTVRLTRAELASLEAVGEGRGQTARELARDAIVAATRPGVAP